MKEAIANSLPRPLARWIHDRRLESRIRREFRADSSRYSNSAAPVDRVLTPMAPAALETQATKDYHRVEKGLTLRAPKRPFGADVGRRLDEMLPLLEPETELERSARSAREALRQWNENGTISDEVSPVAHPTREMSRDQLSELFTGRHSVRNFDTTRIVSQQDLLTAARLAGRSPSVCNRQAWKVRFAVTDSAKLILRSHQNGNAGFGEIPVVALITTDARLFAGSGERNQPWIDGGIFAMSLALALHGLSLSSCMLNMSLDNDRADSLRRALGLEDHELIVMEMAIGYAADNHRFARSPRRADGEITSFI